MCLFKIMHFIAAPINQPLWYGWLDTTASTKSVNVFITLLYAFKKAKAHALCI